MPDTQFPPAFRNQGVSAVLSGTTVGGVFELADSLLMIQFFYELCRAGKDLRMNDTKTRCVTSRYLSSQSIDRL